MSSEGEEEAEEEEEYVRLVRLACGNVICLHSHDVG